MAVRADKELLKMKEDLSNRIVKYIRKRDLPRDKTFKVETVLNKAFREIDEHLNK